MGLINWVKNLLISEPLVDEEIIVLEEVMEESLYPQKLTVSKKDSIRDALNVRGELKIGEKNGIN